MKMHVPNNVGNNANASNGYFKLIAHPKLLSIFFYKSWFLIKKCMDFVEKTFSQNNVHCHKDNEIQHTITLKLKYHNFVVKGMIIVKISWIF
jgi:hypothetical protein